MITVKKSLGKLKTDLSIMFVLLILALSGGCSGSDDSTFAIEEGKYQFIMYDSTGKLMKLKGVMNVTSYIGDKVSGTLEYTNVYDDDFPGFSSMSKEFEGNVNKTEKTIWINTNPRIADSNVFWNLKMRKSYARGEWNYSVFRGQTTKGEVKLTSMK